MATFGAAHLHSPRLRLHSLRSHISTRDFGAEHHRSRGAYGRIIRPQRMKAPLSDRDCFIRDLHCRDGASDLVPAALGRARVAHMYHCPDCFLLHHDS